MFNQQKKIKNVLSWAVPNGMDCRHACLKTSFPHPCPQPIPHYVLTKLNKKSLHYIPLNKKRFA